MAARGGWLGLVWLGACGAGDGMRSTAASRAPTDNTAAVLRTDGDPALVLGDGGSHWGQRMIPWQLAGPLPEGVTATCLARPDAACRRWQPGATAGTWQLADRDGDHPLVLWGEGPGGRRVLATATVALDRQAPTPGAATAEGAPASIRVSWAPATDTGAGVAAHALHVAPGVTAPDCDSGAAPAWTGGPDATEALLALPEPTVHAVRLCITDAVGNTAAAPLLRATPLPDTAPPTVHRLVLSGGQPAITTREVRLEGEVVDPSGAIQVCASETAAGAADCRAWRSWASGMAVDLADVDGPHTLRLWFRDRYGNTTDAVERSVLVDRTGPRDGTVAGTDVGGEVVLSWSGFTDLHSEVVAYVVKTAPTWAPARCSEGTEVYRGPAQAVTIGGLAGGAHSGFRVCALDALGNSSRGANTRVYVAEEFAPPVVEAFTLNGGAPHAWTRTVSVEIAATDASGVARSCIAFAPEGCSDWQPFVAETTLTLPAAPGSHTAWLWLEDGQGVQSPTPVAASVAWSPPQDADGDGVDESQDCDDGDPSVAPGRAERCDGRDNDCDGEIDGPDAVDAPLWYPDRDGDGHGDPDGAVAACAAPPGHIADGTDCNDAYDTVYPAAGCSVPTSCQDLLEMGHTADGVYLVGPEGDGSRARVRCDQTRDGGGWTLVVDWDAEDGLAALLGEADAPAAVPPVELVHRSMATLEMAPAGLRWCAGEVGASGPVQAGVLALEAPVPVPNGGELRHELGLHAASMEGGGLWLAAGLEAGGFAGLWCRSDESGRDAGAGLSPQQRRLTSLACDEGWPATERQGGLWVELDEIAELEGSIDRVVLRSLHRDRACSDRSTLGHLTLWVR